MSDRLRRLYPFLAALMFLAILVGLPWYLYIQSKNKPEYLKISGGEKGGVYALVASGIVDVVEDAYPKLNLHYEGSSGSMENMRRLNAGTHQLALVQNGTPGGDSIRVLTPLYPEVLHILVRSDLEAETLKDLSEARLAIGPPGSGTGELVTNLFTHYGLDASQLDRLDLGMKESCDALLNNSVDAVFIVAGLFAPAINETMMTGEVRLLGMGTPGEIGGEATGFSLHYPEVTPYVIPRYTYQHAGSEPGYPREPVQTVAVPSLLVCHVDLDKRLVTKITQSVYEHRAALIERHVAASHIRPPDDATEISYPIHLGAEAYYRRDEPSFIVVYAEVLALIMSVVITLFSMVIALRKWTSIARKDRIDRYYVRLDKLLAQLSDEEIESERLYAIEEELSTMRHEALGELVHEKLQPDESFRIFQTLLANSQTEVRNQLARQKPSG